VAISLAHLSSDLAFSALGPSTEYVFRLIFDLGDRLMRDHRPGTVMANRPERGERGSGEERGRRGY
jgi:hypothetical protein